MYVANQIENDHHYFVLFPVHAYPELDLVKNAGKTPKVALQSASVVNQFLTRNIH